MALLEITHLAAGYGEVQILWDVSLKLEGGKLTSLVGSNGAGKTTLLRAVMDLIRPWRGAISFDGRDVTQVVTADKAAQGLILVPEGRQLFTDMTIADNLALGAFTVRARPQLARNRQRVYDLFPLLAERKEQKAGTLSGGEQQMLALARALMGQPEILMIDEMSLGLSPARVLELFEVVLRLKAEGMTILLVEQNVRMALAVSDYAYVLAEGKMELEGPARQVAADERVRKAYLGL
jgi:branched-chain amino acid transport system ATP-binding protein